RYLRLPRGFHLTDLPVITAQPVPDVTSASVPPQELQAVSGNPIVLPPTVIANSRAIYARGQGMGNNFGLVIKVGDSNMANYEYLCNFGRGKYDRGNNYGNILKGVEDMLKDSGSFCYEGLTNYAGRTASRILDPL